MIKEAFSKALGIDVATDTAREVKSQVGGAAGRTRGLLRWFRAIFFGNPDDGFRPSSDDAREKFAESMDHYEADEDFVAKRIRRTHKAFLAYAAMTTAVIVVAVVVCKAHPLTSSGCGFLAFIFAAQAFQSAIENHVLRHRAAPGLRAILFSGDLLPKGN